MNNIFESVKSAQILPVLAGKKAEGFGLMCISSCEVTRSRTRLIYTLYKGDEMTCILTDVKNETEVDSADVIYPEAAGFQNEIEETGKVIFINSSSEGNGGSGMLSLEAVKVNPSDFLADRCWAFAPGDFLMKKGLCQVVEELGQISLPPRAAAIRDILTVISEIEMNLLWLAETAEEMGVQNLWNKAMMLREVPLAILDEHAGGRIIQDICAAGGLSRDIDDEALATVAEKVSAMADNARALGKGFTRPGFVSRKLKKIGKFDQTSVRIEAVVDKISALGEMINAVPEGDIRAEMPETFQGQAAAAFEIAGGRAFAYAEGNDRKTIKNIVLKIPEIRHI